MNAGVVRRILAVLFLAVQPLFAQVSGATSEFEAAAAAERSGRYQEAAAHYQQFLSGADPSKTSPSMLAVARTRLATAYFLLHRYQDSLEAVAPLTAKDSRYAGVPAQAWLVRGLDCLELQRLPEAIAALQHTLALNPSGGTARLALGDALVRSGRLADAVRQYQEQTQQTPSLPDAWYKLGLAYSQLAAQFSREAAQRLPESVFVRQLAAENLLAIGDNQGAASSLLRLVRQAPGQPQIHADFGAALSELGYTKAAEDQFRREVSQDPDSPLARLGVAEAAALRADWEQATSNVDRVIRQNPQELGRLLEIPPPGLLRDAWKQGKIKMPERFARTPAGRLWKAWLEDSQPLPMPSKSGTSRSCSRPSSKAMATPGIWLPEDCYQFVSDRLGGKKALTPQEQIKLTEAEFRLGNHQRARRRAQHMLAANPENEWALYWLGRSNFEVAQDCFSKVAAMNPDSARVHEMLGQYYADHHIFPRAKGEYIAAIRLSPELPDLHLGLAELYWVSGELPEAEKEFLRTLELAPGSTTAQFELGDTYVQQRRWQPAIDHLRQAVADPTLAAKVRLDLSQAEAEMGQTQKSIEELLPLLKEDQEGQIHYRLARLYRKIGDKMHEQEAFAAFKRLQANSVGTKRSELEALEKQAETVQPVDASKPPQ